MSINLTRIVYADFDDERNLFTIGVRESSPGESFIHFFHIQEGAAGLVLRADVGMVPFTDEIIPCFPTYYASEGIHINYQSSQAPRRLDSLPEDLAGFLSRVPVEGVPEGEQRSMRIQIPPSDDFYRGFPIQTISRADLCDTNLPSPLTEEQARLLDDAAMVSLTRKLREAYMNSGIYWSSLKDWIHDNLTLR